MDTLQPAPAYMAGVSAFQIRWTSREPPASSPYVSEPADATDPGEKCASHNGPDHEAPVRLETGWDQSPRGRNPQLFLPERRLTPPPPSRRWIPPRSAHTKEYCTCDIVVSGSPPLAFRCGRFPVSRSKGISYSCAEQFFAAEKRRLFQDHRTSQQCPTLDSMRNMDEKSLISISPCGNASENMLCLSALTPSLPKTQKCNHISWARATGFSRKLAIAPSYGTSDIGLTTSLHASRRYGAACFFWARLCKPCDVSYATAHRHRHAANFCFLRAPRHPVETASSKLTLLRDSGCVQVTRHQPSGRRATPTLYQTCHRTTTAMFSL